MIILYCKKCGCHLEDGSKFCGNCGCEVVNDNGNHNVNSEGKSNVSIILGIIAIMMLWLPFVCIPLAIASIVIGVKNKKYDNRNTGIILGVVSLVLSIIYIIVIVGFTFFVFNIAKDEFDDIWDWTEDYFEDGSESSFDLSGERYQVSDGGVIYFDKSMSYSWYMDDNNHNDNYVLGTYQVYNGIDAIRYINDEYSIDIEDQYSLFTKCYEGVYCKDIDHYYLIVFNSYYRYVDGVGSNSNDSTAYYGFYDEEDMYFDMKDIVKGDRVGFAKVDSISGDNTI